MLAIVIAIAYIYEKERKKYIGMAKDKAKEKSDEAKDKANNVRSSPDYELDIDLLGKNISCTLDFNKSED